MKSQTQNTILTSKGIKIIYSEPNRSVRGLRTGFSFYKITFSDIDGHVGLYNNIMQKETSTSLLFSSFLFFFFFFSFLYQTGAYYVFNCLRTPAWPRTHSDMAASAS